MDVIYRRCCGIDVHKKIIVACLRVGHKNELMEFGTSTSEIQRMAKWLQEHECEIVAMESTGSYWKPIYNVLELLGMDVIVVNAQHVKAVPGRKTDVKDAQWIADLLQHGLLKASYIPTREQRELREISRYRKSLVEERARELNRLGKVLEGGNIKLTSVVKDINGVTSRKLLDALITDGVNETNIDEMLYGSLREKRAELLEACNGVLSRMQCQLVRAMLDHIDDMTKRIGEIGKIINEHMHEYEDAIERLDEIPGISQQSAQVILAEIGLDMSRFPTAGHLARWAGLAPGNNESAKRRKNGRTTKGNMTLKTTLIQCAKTAKRKKGSFFKAQFERLAVRRGKNRATVAVAHSMLIAIYHMLNENEHFVDLGESYYIERNPQRKINYLLKKLDALGWQPPTPVTA
jgi:transposase